MIKIGKIKDFNDIVLFVGPPVITLVSILAVIIHAIDGDWDTVILAFCAAAGWGIVWLNAHKIWG